MMIRLVNLILSRICYFIFSLYLSTVVVEIWGCSPIFTTSSYNVYERSARAIVDGRQNLRRKHSHGEIHDTLSRCVLTSRRDSMTELKQANKSSVFVLDWAAVAASGVVNEFFALARNLLPTEGRTVVLSYLSHPDSMSFERYILE